MTDTFRVDNLAAATGGTWIRRPAVDAVGGVGTDTREELAGMLFAAIRGERHDGHDHLAEAGDAAAVLVERDPPPGVLPETVGVLRVTDTVAALASLAALHRRTLDRTTVIAITGSAGKTTTKQLVHAALGAALPGRAAPRSFNNHLGVPLTLLSARPEDRYLVVEIGSNASGEIATLGALCAPDVAVITMVGRSHLAGLGDIHDVAREKLTLLDHVRRGGAAILNGDCPHLRAAARSGPVVLFGSDRGCHLRLTGRGRVGDRWWLEVNGTTRFEVPAPGEHMAFNTLAAIAVARHLGVDDDDARRGLADAKLPPMRLQIESIGDARIWNDAYNANPESMRVALAAFAEEESDARRRVLVLGDMLELGVAEADLHRELASAIATLHGTAPLDRVILVGPACRHTCEALHRALPALAVRRIDELDRETMIRLAQSILPGDAVLVKASRGVALERLVDQLRASSLNPQAPSLAL